LSRNNKGIINLVWDFFCSVKLTIFILLSLAITSIIGTIVAQNKPMQFYLEKVGYSQTKYELYDKLQFLDMYHSYWFMGLLGLFAINLIFCSIKRLPGVWKIAMVPVLVPGKHLLSDEHEEVVSMPVETVRDKLSASLTKHFAKTVATEDDGKVYLYTEKGRFSRFGVYTTHFSILFIFLGAIVGNIFGYKAYVNIEEGHAIDTVYPMNGGEPIPLGFEVKCESFSLTYYEGTMRPREYRSVLTVSENGKTVIDKRPIVVNDPLGYKGIVFYQSSYGPTGSPVFNITATSRVSGESVTRTGRLGEIMKLSSGAFRVADYAESFREFGPAVKLDVFPEGEQKKTFILLKEHPEFDEQRDGLYTFKINQIKQGYYTGLQVAKDPGVWIVWAGCFLLIFGSMVAFFMSHRRIWVRIQPEGDKTRITYGKSAHRNQAAYSIYFEKLAQTLKDELSA